MKRTAYAVRLVCGQWAGDRRYWVDDPTWARHFATMTAAGIYAVYELELAPDDFTIEAVL